MFVVHAVSGRKAIPCYLLCVELVTSSSFDRVLSNLVLIQVHTIKAKKATLSPICRGRSWKTLASRHRRRTMAML